MSVNRKIEETTFYYKRNKYIIIKITILITNSNETLENLLWEGGEMRNF